MLQRCVQSGDRLNYRGIDCMKLFISIIFLCGFSELGYAQDFEKNVCYNTTFLSEEKIFDRMDI